MYGNRISSGFRGCLSQGQGGVSDELGGITDDPTLGKCDVNGYENH